MYLSSKARLKLAAASALSITIKSLSWRFRPDAEKFAAPAIDLVALEVHRCAVVAFGAYLDGRRFS